MPRIHKILLERPYTQAEEIVVLEGPTGRELHSAILRDPHHYVRWTLAEGRLFVSASRLLHRESVRLPLELGLVVLADGGAHWSQEHEGFLVHFNNADAIGPATTERAFWRAFEPYLAFACQSSDGRCASDLPNTEIAFEAHGKSWYPLRPFMSQATRHHDEWHVVRVREAWTTFATRPLETLLDELAREPATNWTAALAEKAKAALSRSDLRVWFDGVRARTVQATWHYSKDAPSVEIDGRRVAIRLEEHSQPHPLFRREKADSFVSASIDERWDDGEELDPVERILVLAELATMHAARARDLVAVRDVPERRRLAEERAQTLASEIAARRERMRAELVPSVEAPVPWSL